MDEFSSALQRLSSLHDAQIKGEGLIAHDYSHKLMYQRKVIMKSLSLSLSIALSERLEEGERVRRQLEEKCEALKKANDE